MTDRPTPTVPAPAEASLEVRVSFRLVAGAAATLILLFTLQNYLTVGFLRGQSLPRIFGLQVIIWTTWLVLSPLVVAAARRWRRNPRLTAGAVMSQLLISFAVALLHSIVSGTTRWVLGVSVADDLGVVLVNSIMANVATNVLRYWLIASAYHAVAYHREVRARDVSAARLEGSLVQAKLDSLQGRLQPHFLFNTLNSIGALIHEQPAAAQQMLGSLSDLLRASLHAEPSREVTLERELDLVRQYVSIQQMRFQDRLSVSIETGPDVLQAYVPHLVLQPLVENAIQHGIAPREAPGHVRIAAGRAGDRLRLTVEDDGVGVESAGARASGQANGGSSRTAGSGFGITGTQARLRHLYGGDATLDVQARTPTGFAATVEMPYHTSPVVPEAAPPSRRNSQSASARQAPS